MCERVRVHVVECSCLNGIACCHLRMYACVCMHAYMHAYVNVPKQDNYRGWTVCEWDFMVPFSCMCLCVSKLPDGCKVVAQT